MCDGPTLAHVQQVRARVVGERRIERDRGRGLRARVDADRAQRHRDPDPDRLDVRLLERPQLEEALALRFGRQRVERGALALGEHVPGEAIDLEPAIDVLDVDADVVLERHAARDQPARVREVEAQARVALRRGQLGPPVLAVRELQLARRHAAQLRQHVRGRARAPSGSSGDPRRSESAARARARRRTAARGSARRSLRPRPRRSTRRTAAVHPRAAGPAARSTSRRAARPRPTYSTHAAAPAARAERSARRRAFGSGGALFAAEEAARERRHRLGGACCTAAALRARPSRSAPSSGRPANCISPSCSYSGLHALGEQAHAVQVGHDAREEQVAEHVHLARGQEAAARLPLRRGRSARTRRSARSARASRGRPRTRSARAPRSRAAGSSFTNCSM